MERRHYLEMQSKIDALLRNRAFRGKAVFVFGHCNATEEMLDLLLSGGVAVSAILDNNPAKQGDCCKGIKITAPEAAPRLFDADSIVLIATRFYEQMAGQLRGLGFPGQIIKVVDYNSFAEYSLSDETLSAKRGRLQRGLSTLERLRGNYLVVCPNNALGDVYWAMAFLPAYCAKHSIEKTSVIVTGSGCRQTAELFTVGPVIELLRDEMDELVQAIVFSREKNAIIAHHDIPYTDRIIRYLDRHFLSFIDYYRHAVYGLDKDAQPAQPARWAACPGFDFPAGRGVILSPHAKSVATIPDAFWIDLAADYRRRGFSVLTSIADGEEPIAGTDAISLPLNQMLPAAEYAGHFIGVRSGLCDILHTAKCDKTAVFPNCTYSTTPHHVADFFELPGWKHKSRV